MDVLTWEAPAGRWTIKRLAMRTTGQTNAPASPEGTGLEIDKMSLDHINYHFDSFIGEILRRIPADSARALLAKFDAGTAADRAAFLAVPLPRTYVFGTTSWDGGTLSGVAKLFYGNGNKWRVIWESNKEAVPNPDYVLSGTSLVIPALPSP